MTTMISIFNLFFLFLIGYSLYLAIRLVNAVEKIANHLTREHVPAEAKIPFGE